MIKYINQYYYICVYTKKPPLEIFTYPANIVCSIHVEKHNVAVIQISGFIPFTNDIYYWFKSGQYAFEPVILSPIGDIQSYLLSSLDYRYKKLASNIRTILINKILNI